jgi:alpha-galactosidase
MMNDLRVTALVFPSLTLRRRRTVAPAPARGVRGVIRGLVCAAACAGACLWLSPIASAADRPPIVASRGDAFISHQSGSDTWSIGSGQLELVVGFDASHTLTLQRLFNPAVGRSWEITPGADVSLTAGGERIALTSSGAVRFISATAQPTDRGVMLAFNFEYRAQRLLVTRVYACYPGSPTIETWTRMSSGGGDGSPVTDLVGWQITMPVGHVRWLGGLRGDSAAGHSVADAFVVADRDLEPGERIEIGSEGRSSETFVPLLFVGGGPDEFFGGLMWSGSWRAELERAGDRMRVTLFFPGITTSVTAAKTLEVPHTFFGVTARDVAGESSALHQFVIQGIRQGRPFQPLVTYNTWFPYGTQVNEDQMVAEIDRAASLGAELVVLDAGWYVGAGDINDYDFESGLGTWAEDKYRFPSGIASLSDYAHGLGLKFGIWVEPERVALAWVDKAGLAQEAWLATRDGGYGSARTAQICLAGAAGRQWVLDQLIALIERVRPDYLKWDNNFWINCDRAGHGHGAADGSLAHVQALYEILDTLRVRYPRMLIENVSGGGTRIDFGMLAYTDVAWMDDRTSPSSLVRHNLEGLTLAFPPAYLLSFLIDADGEPIAGADDLQLLTRSRMPGVFGMTYRTDLLPEDTAASLADEIAQYKTYRDIIAGADASLLTLQTPYDESGWDVLQEVAGDGLNALIFGFNSEFGSERLVVRPRGLQPAATYDVSSLDLGPIGTASGNTLMEEGIELTPNGGSRAHVLILKGR